MYQKKKIVLNLLMLFVQRISKYGFVCHTYNDYHRGIGASAFQDRRLYFNAHASVSPSSLSISASLDSCTLKSEMFYILDINENDTFGSCKERFEKMFEAMIPYIEKVLEPHKEDRRKF